MTEIRNSIQECRPHKDPLERPDYTEAEISALRAVQNGSADARQQKMLCDYLIRAAGTYDASFRPGDTHGTAFAEGKRWVGTTFVWMLNVAPARTDPDKIAARSIKNEEQGK